MWIWSVLFIVGSIWRSEATGLADMISNYAKVAFSNGSTSPRPSTIFANFSSTTPLPSTKSENELEEDAPDYEDFDDLQETSNSTNAARFDSNTAMKYLNGVVNLLALMYSFNGQKKSLNPESWHFGPSHPRQAGRDGFAEDINNLAQDRFHPTTATKKFKLQQGYSSVDTFPPYDPYAKNPAESYNSNGGKTSYDSDAAMYLINPPKNDLAATNDVKQVSQSVKNPMKDYMAQNDDVDIQQSYSYTVPDGGIVADKGKMKKPVYYYDNPILPTPSPPTKEESKNNYPWMMKDSKKIVQTESVHPWNSKPPTNDDHIGPDHSYGDDHIPIYYPWMSAEAEKKPKPMADKPDWMDGPPADEDDHIAPSYYPWMSKPKKKTKPPPPPPPPPMEEEELDDDQQWMTKEKLPMPDDALPPPPHKDHLHYPYWQDDHHQFIDDHHAEEEEEEHQMKDEDRESKRPYTYYHLGRKLWYIPLLFSVYFILYIGSLILKSIARHKVQLPEKLWELHDNEHHHHGGHDRRRQLNDVTQRVFNAINKKENKFM